MALLHRFWLWLRVMFTGHMSLREIATDVRNTIADVGKSVTKKNKKHQGTLIWDGRLGTFYRKTAKVGRNAPCPCGAMRKEPHDVTLRNKAKWCCHGS